MKTIRFTLKQHTPLIHFQYNQPGATLRASEIKPRFDRFLIGNDTFEKWKEFVVGYIDPNSIQILDESSKESKIKKITKSNSELKKKFDETPDNTVKFRALDYKLRVFSVTNKKTTNNLPMYFAGNSKKGVMASGSIIVEFSSNKAGLIQLIGEKFSDFLARTNFGNRQTKGYGCFYIDGEKPKGANYSFKVKNVRNVEDLFTQIADFYAVLRAGINNNGVYIKSALYKYLHERGIQWDKKTIKQAFYTDKEKERCKRFSKNHSLLGKNTGEEKLYKDFLGLSTVEKWVPVKEDKVSYILKKSSKGIARFKSPILLKPILVNDSEYDVYIYISPIPNFMKNAKFSLQWGKNQNFNIKTADDFVIEDYFNWIFENKNTICGRKSNVGSSQKHTPRENIAIREGNIQACFSSLVKNPQ